MLIHLAAATLNREAEGMGVVGGAAATYSRGGADITSHDWVIGTELTQFDADAYVLARMVEVLAQCYDSKVAPPTYIYAFCSSTPALQAVQNTQSIKAHDYTLRFHKALTTFFTNHTNVRLVLCWAPRDNSLEGNWLARSLAIQCCSADIADLPDGMDHVQSAAYQKDRTQRRAFHQWELDYQLARACNDLQVNTTGHPLDRAAYQYVISQPPYGPPQLLWKKTSGVERHGVLFSRDGPPPQQCNLQWTTPSPAHMLGDFTPPTLLNPYGALVDFTSVTPTISSDTAATSTCSVSLAS
jgi:hypothetical protein